MWLRNWYSLLNAIILSRSNDSLPGENPTDTPPITVRNFNGSYVIASEQTSRQLGNNYHFSPSDLVAPGKFSIALGISYSSTGEMAYSIIMGTGTTPVTLNDYRVETPITSGLSLASTSTTLVNKTALNNGRYSYKTRAAVNNTSTNQITINEIALNTPNRYGSFCVYREVLSSAITLDPGDTVLVEFEWDAPIYAAPTP